MRFRSLPAPFPLPFASHPAPFPPKVLPVTMITGTPQWLIDVFAIARLPSNAPRADGCDRRRRRLEQVNPNPHPNLILALTLA